MLRVLFSTVAIFCICATSVLAQNASATASQTIQLVLYPAMDLKFSATNASSGSLVNMAFSNSAHYNNGIVSGGQELTIRSNKDFKISVKTSAASFSYSGTATQAQSMPVDNTLFMSVTDNTTGGNTSSSFNNTYNSLSSSNQDIILNGQRGDDKKLVLAYKAKPGMGYPAGIYSVDVVYTATQP